MNALKVMEFAKELLLIDSPTGYTKAVIDFYEKEVKALGYETMHTNPFWIYRNVNCRPSRFSCRFRRWFTC